MVSARRALAVALVPHLAETLLEGVVEKQPADQGLPLAEDDLHAFDGLDEPDDAGQDAQDARFLARGSQLGGRRLGEQAAVARPAAAWDERGRLSVEAEDGAVSV